MKRIIFILLMISLLNVLLGAERYIFLNEKRFVKDEIPNEFTLIESFTFDEGFMKLELTTPSEISSGTLSFAARRSEDGMHAEILAFDGINNVNKYQLDIEYLCTVSPGGEYYLTEKDHKEFILYKKSGKVCYSMQNEGLYRGPISSTGLQAMKRKSNYNILLVNNNGNIMCEIPALVDSVQWGLAYCNFYYNDKLRAIHVGSIYGESWENSSPGDRDYSFLMKIILYRISLMSAGKI
ncbi:MAG: hypothetical protein K9M99_10835 [Candidatus Cloacimonetes bacterium]|nr:hypothetical protein [Candidatus Cloacimonadota bacterium]